MQFRLWAPSTRTAELTLSVPGGATDAEGMNAEADGWHSLTVAGAGAGTSYQFIVDTPQFQRLAVPDPASRWNPLGVHGPSLVTDPAAYRWQCATWHGRGWPDAVVYEMHVGTFTAEGTFAAALSRLEFLADIGVTALQLMPVAAFSGRRNWGYDGVLPFAPAECYGRPDDLKMLIDTAHSVGMMVLLDVVYNHFGPDGNYLHAYCPEFFNSTYRTPWGPAINFDGAHSRPVRDFFVQNALYWVTEYRFDGLRLDAVHAMHDASTPAIVCEIATALRSGPGRDRDVHLVLENNANQARYLTRDRTGKPLHATAQWDDDVHHALHVVVSGESDGYYADYMAAPYEHLAKSLAERFAYQGEYSAFRDTVRGEPSARLPPAAFVGFLQNHDMIGNRAYGERIHSVGDARLLPAAYACLLLTPEIPMLFMGEEFAASSPFLYFCDFGADLAKSVSAGRRREFKRFAAFVEDGAAAPIPDPGAESTFRASKLNWEDLESAPHQRQLALVRELLALRRRHLTPLIDQATRAGRWHASGAVVDVEWPLSGGGVWHLLAYFGSHDIRAPERLPDQAIYRRGMERGASGEFILTPGAVQIAYVRARRQ